MIRSLPLLLVATPAAAHEGAHLHPHGAGEVWLGLALGAAAVVAGLLVVRGRR